MRILWDGRGNRKKQIWWCKSNRLTGFGCIINFFVRDYRMHYLPIEWDDQWKSRGILKNVIWRCIDCILYSEFSHFLCLVEKVASHLRKTQGIGCRWRQGGVSCLRKIRGIGCRWRQRGGAGFVKRLCIHPLLSKACGLISAPGPWIRFSSVSWSQPLKAQA